MATEEYGGNSHKMKDEQKALPDKSSEKKKAEKVISLRRKVRYRSSLMSSFRKMSET